MSDSSYQDDSETFSGKKPEGLISTLSRLLPQILGLYKSRFTSTKQLFGIEWELSLRCIALVLGLAIFAFAVLLVTWISLMALVAYLLYSIDVSGWLIITAVILIQLAVLWWISHSVKSLTSEIGFKRSLQAILQPSEQNLPVKASPMASAEAAPEIKLN